MRVAIIGAGLAGVTSAYFLAKAGAEVTLFDQEGHVACGASYANGGMLTPSMADPWNAPGIHWQILKSLVGGASPILLRPQALPSAMRWGLAFLRNSTSRRYEESMQRNLSLAIYSLRVLRQLREETGLTYDGRTNGTIKLFRSAQAFGQCGTTISKLSRLGVELQPLSKGDVLRLEPGLADIAPVIVGGVLCTGDESGDARLFCEGLARRSIELGAEFAMAHRVTGFRRDGSGIREVETVHGCFPTDAVVVAAGSLSGSLLKSLRVRLPVQPIKGYSITLERGRWPGSLNRPVVDDTLHAAVTPLGSTLRVAGTAEIAGFDRSVRADRIENLFSLLEAILPSFRPYIERASARPWAGLRPVTPDGVPMIGPTRVPNLYVNTGHGHLGWTLAAGSAELLADLVLGRAPRLEPAPYRPIRF